MTPGAAVESNPWAGHEPPMHRPRPCPACGRLSTALDTRRCLACRTDADPPPASERPACITCGQRLLLIRANRDVCERCRLDANQTPDATPAPDGNSPRTERPAGGTDTTKEN